MGYWVLKANPFNDHPNPPIWHLYSHQFSPPPLFGAQFATNNSHLNFINSLSKTSVVLCWQSPSPCYRGLVKRFFLIILWCLFFEKLVSSKKLIEIAYGFEQATKIRRPPLIVSWTLWTAHIWSFSTCCNESRNH